MKKNDNDMTKKGMPNWKYFGILQLSRWCVSESTFVILVLKVLMYNVTYDKSGFGFFDFQFPTEYFGKSFPLLCSDSFPIYYLLIKNPPSLH